MIRFRIAPFALVCSLLFPATAWADGIGTDRPTSGEASTTVGTGVFQVEAGADWETYGDDVATVHAFRTPVELRYGLTDNTEFHFQTAGYALQVADFGESTSTVDGFADLEAGLKANVLAAEGWRPSLGFSLTLTAPTGSPDFRTNTVTPTAKLLADFALPAELGLGVNVGVTTVSDDETGRVDVPVLYAAALGRSVASSLGVFAEVYGSVATDGSGDSSAILDAGVLWAVSDDVQLDLAARTGLSNGPDFGATVGVSFRFFTAD